MTNFPKHVVVIPDGNRRWAKKRGLPAWAGHQAGAKALEKILDKNWDLQIPYFTFWGASWDNLTKRSKPEVSFLFKLFAKYFQRAAKSKRIHSEKAKITVLGRWKEIMPKESAKAIENAVEATKNYDKSFLTFLLAYDGRDEMLDCIRKIAKKGYSKITPELVRENLWTKDLPLVDLVIRTGSSEDPHNSAGFMMWDTAYSQLHYSKLMFPALSPKEYEKIIKDYSKRERRMGK